MQSSESDEEDDDPFLVTFLAASFFGFVADFLVVSFALDEALVAGFLSSSESELLSSFLALVLAFAFSVVALFLSLACPMAPS